MDFAFITSVSEVRERSKFDIEERIAFLQARRAARSSDDSSSSNGGGRNYMKGGQETEEFMTARELFKVHLSRVLTEKAVAEGAPIQAVGVFVNTGREFDKVLVASFKTVEKSPKKMDVMFFIHRKTGAIFAPKSPISPNIKHYCGTLWTVDKWDWTGDRPVPLNNDKEAAGVIEEGFYKPYKHYIPSDPILYKKIYGKDLELPLDKSVAL